MYWCCCPRRWGSYRRKRACQKPGAWRRSLTSFECLGPAMTMHSTVLDSEPLNLIFTITLPSKYELHRKLCANPASEKKGTSTTCSKSTDLATRFGTCWGPFEIFMLPILATGSPTETFHSLKIQGMTIHPTRAQYPLVLRMMANDVSP